VRKEERSAVSEFKIAGASFFVAVSVDNSAKTGGDGVVFRREYENVEAAMARAVSAGAVAEEEVAECEGAVACSFLFVFIPISGSSFYSF
jgi:hypothetical protein